MSRSWIQTYTGLLFDPLAPREEDVCIEDIAHALSMICRYSGQSKYFYSVAEHSVLVSYLCQPAFAREALLHDASEAYLGDVSRPLKRHPVFAGYLEIEAKLENVIAKRFNLRTDDAAKATWKEFDNRILVDEIAALMPNPEAYHDEWLATLKPTGAEIMCYPPGYAEALFTARFAELFPEWCPEDLKIEGLPDNPWATDEKR